MPCGCQKNKKSASLPSSVASARPAPKESGRVAVYEVKVNDEVVLTTASPTAARQEASRLGGNIRVTSRPINAGDPVAV